MINDCKREHFCLLCAQKARKPRAKSLRGPILQHCKHQSSEGVAMTRVSLVGRKERSTAQKDQRHARASVSDESETRERAPRAQWSRWTNKVIPTVQMICCTIGIILFTHSFWGK
mmetsp:Transcript_8819/g.13945  ORF Transcript_8819/g.13945 Transcript_8819/m.13945 type:complete len:115 (-) Transcript_8819:122-466(-)